MSIDEDANEEKDKGFFEKMKFQMMQNIQITLKNLHVCYETNSTTKLGHPFSFGLTIHSIQLSVRPLNIVFKKNFLFFRLQQMQNEWEKTKKILS